MLLLNAIEIRFHVTIYFRPLYYLYFFLFPIIPSSTVNNLSRCAYRNFILRYIHPVDHSQQELSIIVYAFLKISQTNL